MGKHRVLILGDSLFAEVLSSMLSGNGVRVVGVAPTLQAALPLLDSVRPDVVIMAEAVATDATAVAALGGALLDIPLIMADLERHYMRLVTSQLICARSNDLLDVIAALPQQHADVNDS